jgi:hypothetical protein
VPIYIPLQYHFRYRAAQLPTPSTAQPYFSPAPLVPRVFVLFCVKCRPPVGLGDSMRDRRSLLKEKPRWPGTGLRLRLRWILRGEPTDRDSARTDNKNG